ncbi:MAG: hypothetical protein HKO82_01175 [Acidimicrobiia bacterium]|nr:hypothetical protein [Acidimicrobiia bacterium]MBT8246753.1 hypothetical protein [Acidimicrobiia bacterium]NNJ46357.1 hypothetical protein [Acidimicrobiia bacterium]NNL12282.1 hypothetical protein [Acidimicrobiia bacterium]
MRFTAILLVLALALMGCGGSDSDSDPPAVTTTTVATTTSQATDTTDPPDGDVDFNNCPELLQWSSDWGAASQAAFSGGTDPTGFEYTAEYFQEFADRAPGEISDDMQVIADAFRDLFDALEELDIDLTDPTAAASMTQADFEKLEEAFRFMDNDAIDAAATNIEEFFERECS